MPTPILFDTDMGIDDAVALALAAGSPEVSIAGVVSVGGNVSLEQATLNAAKLSHAIHPKHAWPIARGLDQAQSDLENAAHVFGDDGFGGVVLETPRKKKPLDFKKLYRQAIEAHGDELVVVAVGPLTNLAAIHKESPELLRRIGRIVVMGGAVWCKGNVTPHAEFNFYRDPQAADDVLSAGLPVTVVPLDLTRQVPMDESHAAHLARSGNAVADILAQMVQFSLQRDVEAGQGTFLVHDALAVGAIIWPELFLRSKVALDVVVEGQQAGKCRPTATSDKSRQVSVTISVQVVAFLENMLERLCQEHFVV